MAQAICETVDRIIAAEQKVRARRIADRPAALAVGDVDERARGRADDRRIQRHLFAERRARISEAQQMNLRRTPPVAWAPWAALRLRGPPPRRRERMIFADDGFAAHPKGGAALATVHAGEKAALGLFDPRRRPRAV